MTIAIDKNSGKVIGQWCGPMACDNWLLRLLTKNGYVYVPASSVRLEVVR